MQLFYINLARRTDRRAFMEEQFDRLGLAATRIEAVTPADLSAEDVDRWCHPRRPGWLTEGEFCCSSSHIRALEIFLAGEGEWAAIFEDDAVLSPRLAAFFAAYDAAPSAADLVRIETFLCPLTLFPGEPAGAGVRLSRYVGWEGGSAGYIVSRSAAARILASGEMQRRPVDVALFHWSSRLRRELAIRQADPGLCVQADRVAVELGPKSDLVARTQRESAERPYAARHRVYRIWRWIDRDIVAAVWKAWHRFVLGGKRRRVQFAAQ